MKSSTFLIRISQKVLFQKPGAVIVQARTSPHITADQPTHAIEPTSSDLVAHLHKLLRSMQRFGRLIARRVLPGVSARLREAIADPAPAVESDSIVDESSRVPT